jgi:hypothetical protein
MTLTRGLGRRYDGEAAARQTSSLAALAVTLFLIVVGLYLVDALRRQGDFQDCVLSGRIGCETYVR